MLIKRFILVVFGGLLALLLLAIFGKINDRCASCSRRVNFIYPVFSGDSVLDRMIYDIAIEYGEDPFKFAGLIKKENRTFDVRLKGSKGEKGLCQILFYDDILYNPEINMRIACLKLKYFKVFFPTDYYQAYNVGFQPIKNGYQRDVFAYADSFKSRYERDIKTRKRK